MDLSTGLGLGFGAVVLLTLILMGGEIGMFVDTHAFIVIFGGSSRGDADPISAVLACSTACRSASKFAFTLRRSTARELVDEIAEPRRDRPQAGTDRPGKGRRSRTPFLRQRHAATWRTVTTPTSFATISSATWTTSCAHLDEGQKIYRAIGDCAPAFGMVGTLIGMVQMFANMTDPSKLGPFMAVALLATFYGAALANLFCLPIADKLHAQAARRGDQPLADHRRHADDPRRQEPDAGARDAAGLSARRKHRHARAGSRGAGRG